MRWGRGACGGYRRVRAALMIRHTFVLCSTILFDMLTLDRSNREGLLRASRSDWNKPEESRMRYMMDGCEGIAAFTRVQKRRCPTPSGISFTYTAPRSSYTWVGHTRSGNVLTPKQPSLPHSVHAAQIKHLTASYSHLPAARGYDPGAHSFQLRERHDSKIRLTAHSHPGRRAHFVTRNPDTVA